MSKIADIQRILGVVPDGKWGPKSQAALDAAKAPTFVDVLTGGSVDDRSEKNIATLNPKVQPFARQLLHNAKAAGMNFVITSGSRTFEEQAELRTKYEHGGPKAARAGYSNHNFGLAFDVTEFSDGKPVWDSPNYKRLGEMGTSLGLFWGGNWGGGDEDQPHFELRPDWAKFLKEGDMIAELRRRTNVNQDLLV